MEPVAKVENEMETEETANSDGGGGSRKRPLETSSTDEGHESLVKRSNLTEGRSKDNIHKSPNLNLFKFLNFKMK